MTTSSEQAGELLDLAAERALVLMVGHVFLFNGGVQAVKRMIEAGQLGRVYYLTMERTNLGPIRTDVNAAWDLAAHDISIADYWLGRAPLFVTGTGGGWINPGIEDAVFATFTYPDDVLVNLRCSWLDPRKSRLITVVGDRSMLTLDDMNLAEPIRLYDKGVTDELTEAPLADTFASFRASVRDGSITIPKVTVGEPLKAECDHFLECIALGKQPLSDGTVGLRVVRSLEALSASIAADGLRTPVGDR